VPAVLCIGLAVALSGCGGHSRHVQTRAETLSIYTSLPFEGPYAADARSIYDAEELALNQAGGVVDGFKVVLRRLDDASSAAGGSDPTLVQTNARIAAGDQTTIAYIGELTPGSSLDSIPILGHAGILQVSPGDSATNLTGRTFARVVPPDSEEAVAQLASMHKLGVKRLYLIKDRSTYGRDIATVAAGDALAYGIEVVDPGGRYPGSASHGLLTAIRRSKAGALLYAGMPGDGVAAFWNALSAADHGIKKFASAAITESPSWAQTTASARENSYLSAPGLPRAGLPRAGSQFVADLSAAYGGQVPWASAIFGYVAMSGVLDALYAHGPRVRDPRGKVLNGFLHSPRSLPSALGMYSIVGGETSFANYFFTTYGKNGELGPYSPDPG
jgi:branched-chain amino acid transport system substrate-binding protein